MLRQPDVYFVPTPDRVIAEMVRIAQVGSEDFVLDLGCGDGRVLIEAVRRNCARGIGVDLDPRLLAEAAAAAERAAIAGRVEFREEDLFQTDLSGCTVLMLYLVDSINVRLRPTVLQQMAPGSRVVSYSFEMGDWECDDHIPIAANGVFLWVVPANAAGTWRLVGPDGPQTIHLTQKFQMISGSVDTVAGNVCGRLQGSEVALHIPTAPGDLLSLTGQIHVDELHLRDSTGRSYSGQRSS